jgi:hypothetical protein
LPKDRGFTEDRVLMAQLFFSGMMKHAAIAIPSTSNFRACLANPYTQHHKLGGYHKLGIFCNIRDYRKNEISKPDIWLYCPVWLSSISQRSNKIDAPNQEVLMFGAFLYIYNTIVTRT